MTADDDRFATPSQTVGPFFHFGLTARSIVGPGPDAEDAARSWLRVFVTDGDGAPVPDAWLEVWEGGRAAPAGVARLPTDENGACEFEILRAGTHLNVCVFARGLLRHVITRVYFAGDPGLAGDPVLALVPVARRGTLLAHQSAGAARHWRFDIRLQGDDETVFFDV